MHYVRFTASTCVLVAMAGCGAPPAIDQQTYEIMHDINQVSAVNQHKSRANLCGVMIEEYRTLDGQIRTRSRDNGNLSMTSDSVLEYGCTL